MRLDREKVVVSEGGKGDGLGWNGRRRPVWKREVGMAHT